MGLFNKKRVVTTPITDEGRANSLETRRHKQQLKNLEFEKEKLMAEMEIQTVKLDLAQAKAELRQTMNALTGGSADNDTGGIESQMLSYLPQILELVGRKKGIQATAPIQAAEPELIELTDEEIDQLYSEQDKVTIKAAKKMPIENLKTVILNKYPTLSPNSIQKILTKLHP